MALTNGDIPKPPFNSTWTEPQSNANVDTPPKYPYNNVTQTEAGHTFEMDDTPNGERVRLQNGRTGNFIEMRANGDTVLKVKGDGYEIVAGNKNVEIKGFCNITINGDCNLNVNGDMNHKVAKDYNLVVGGQFNLRSRGDMSLSGDADVTLSANENFGGILSLAAADSLYLAADLHIGGSITCDTVTAESRVNAGLGVYAGPYGFTSSLGGLSLGIPTPATPVAVPGSINAVGPITSMVSVNAPAAVFGVATVGIMDAILMTDIINTNIYNFHIHPTPTGPSGPPTTPFFGV